MSAISRYFAYGSNMNPVRVESRGLRYVAVHGARMAGFELRFDKRAAAVAGGAHANIGLRRGARVEGLLYELESVGEIAKMDAFERAPVNYSREMVAVERDGTTLWAWTYFANPAVRATGLRPPRSYMQHLLAGAPYLSESYLDWLNRFDCLEEA